MKLVSVLALVVATTSQSAELSSLQLLSEKFPSLQAELFRNLKDQAIDKSYEFDANRTPEEALKAGMGGHCNMHAQVAALTLIRSGISPANLRIVSAVNNSSLDSLCLGKKGQPAANPRDGLRGHVFLLLKSGGRWYLVNTTTVPGTPPARKFGKLGLEYVPFVSPDELERQIKAGPVPLPNDVKISLPTSIFGGMTIFSSVRPDQYPLNDFSGRRKLIASGSLSSEICRYDGADAEAGTRSSAQSDH